MSWSAVNYEWPNSAATIQTSAESVLTQISGVNSDAIGRIDAIANKVSFSKHPLSSSAEALLTLRSSLESLRVNGQELCIHPYQHAIGTQTESGHHLTPDEANTSLASKLRDYADKYHPKGQLYVVGWMLAESTLANFSNSTQALYDVVNIPELGMVARRVSKEQSLSSDKMTQPNTIVQPRFRPVANVNPKPLRNVETWQGAQIAQLESLAGDKQTPVDKLKQLASKRTAYLQELTQKLEALKQGNVSLYKLEASGSPEVIATLLEQSQPPGRANSHTFACLFISTGPLTFLSELFV